MAKEYSLYEAKARFSEIVRRVRERGETVIVSYHGRAVAEIRPVAKTEVSVDARLDALADEGVIVKPRGPRSFKAVKRVPGGLARFLEDR